MGRVVHFEIFADDAQGAVDFYRTVFGWQMQPWEGPFEYHLTGTGPDTELGIDGAIAPFGDTGRQPVVLTVAVDDLDASMSAALAAGAQPVGEKGAVPGIGWHAYMRDPQGNVFGMMQEDVTAGSEPAVAGVQEAPGAETPSAGAAEADAGSWDEVGERLRDLGASLARAVGETAASPQAQRVREEAERAAVAVREAGKGAADKARPHVVAALDRVSRELDEFATRLRGTADEAAAAAATESAPPAEPVAPTDAPLVDTDAADEPSPEEGRPLA